MSHHSQIFFVFVLLFFVSCSSNDDNAHTTATTYVTPPPRQTLIVAEITDGSGRPTQTEHWDSSVDQSKPLLTFSLEDHRQFRVGEVVPIEFFVGNAKLSGEGGEFRVRYIVDDEEMKWVDKRQPFGLRGWVPGKHTIRLELVGPDGWPYRNGNANIITREIEVIR